MDITRLFLTLFLSLICTTSWATVGVMRFGNGAPVQVCQPSDANTNCGGGTSSVNWTDLGGLQSAVNVSGFTNDPPYIRNADINWTAFPNAQGYITTWTETDPKVGTLITNMAPHWNGTALANGVIYDNGANVGIGSSVPRGALDVNGTIYGSYIWTTNIKSTANNVGIGSSVPHAKLEVLGGIYQSGGTAYFSGNLGIGSSAPATVLDVVGAGTTSTTQSLAIRNSNGTRNVTVLDNGNVGVGSSLPTNLLDVSGGSGNTIMLNNNVGIGTSTPGSKLNVIGGNVGVGTTVPLATMEIVGSGSTSATIGLNVKKSDGTASLTVQDGGNIGIGTSVPRALLEVGVNRLTVLTGGNVGIGSTVPSKALDVVGTVKATFFQSGNIGIGTSGATSCTVTRIEGGIITAASCT